MARRTRGRRMRRSRRGGMFGKKPLSSTAPAERTDVKLDIPVLEKSIEASLTPELEKKVSELADMLKMTSDDDKMTLMNALFDHGIDAARDPNVRPTVEAKFGELATREDKEKANALIKDVIRIASRPPGPSQEEIDRKRAATYQTGSTLSMLMGGRRTRRRRRGGNDGEEDPDYGAPRPLTEEEKDRRRWRSLHGPNVPYRPPPVRRQPPPAPGPAPGPAPTPAPAALGSPLNPSTGRRGPPPPPGAISSPPPPPSKGAISSPPPPPVGLTLRTPGAISGAPPPPPKAGRRRTRRRRGSRRA